jgi:hypothetical protein
MGKKFKEDVSLTSEKVHAYAIVNGNLSLLVSS